MATFSFELVSPERLVFSGQVTEVVVPGSEGQFGVMAGHAPFISTLSAGILTIKGEGADKRLFVRGGFAEANPAGLTVLAEQATPVESFDRAELQQLIKNAQEDVADAKSDEARQKAASNLADLQQVAALLDGAAPTAH
ncbi:MULTISPECIES: F0F1 ATP synthase subunit epsilon [Azorhizobium]|uniref:ATP synthase epsilon chain n=1 Tax=Azorhizobium caulinodans (strain ATCC 43989 / DSM 5975 / JCM 20966 / LMG 6465 / NBRC 14845 / NCIMB 13405 / ORS 571) TaxID=438753 RepID=A8HS09_AZOC5|nr:MULTISPECIES: F0F1 ATP synthase subunit epsilon [Azorhizobium]TDU00575.1 ATP synthase F1 subcomplex epsilon subunit [Azorhizobium sp. AG788]BAF90122.1 H+-transporting two-sector ATPase delta/epsilon subunit [Azorhizobium caulinodans ORS 571]